MLSSTEVIWNNKNITVEKRSIFKKDLFSIGIITIDDLLSDAEILLKGVWILNANLSPIEYFSLMSIVDAIPPEWRQKMRQNTNVTWQRLFGKPSVLGLANLRSTRILLHAITEILFGVFDVEDDWIMLNHLILIAKYYIYTCKLKKANLSLRVYKAKIRAVYQVEKRWQRGGTKCQNIMGNGRGFYYMLARI